MSKALETESVTYYPDPDDNCKQNLFSMLQPHDELLERKHKEWIVGFESNRSEALELRHVAAGTNMYARFPV